MNVSEMTHDDIADFAAQRLNKTGYDFACSNMTSAIHGEQPDVLGINAWGESILIEVKVSRSDFLADKKKPWRNGEVKGIGDFRVYLTPKGLLSPSDIPYGWMLWEVHGKTRPTIKIIKGKDKKMVSNPYFGGKQTNWNFVNCDLAEFNHFKEHGIGKNYNQELTWMIKIMRRAIDDGFNPNKYANNYQDK